MSDSGLTGDPGKFALEDFLPYRLSLLSNTISQGIAEAYRKRYGLSVTEWRVIAILGRFPGLTASEVTNRGAMDKVSVSRAVRRLREKGLVRRNPDAADRRRLALRLTADKGVRIFRQVVPKALAYERQLLAAFASDERASLSQLLAKLQAAADAMNDRAA